jgi:hypothetical protein
MLRSIDLRGPAVLKPLVLLLFVAVGALTLSANLRREAGEWARDLSDRLVMFFLRSTSGFAADVPGQVLEEERERRLRWKRP